MFDKTVVTWIHEASTISVVIAVCGSMVSGSIGTYLERTIIARCTVWHCTTTTKLLANLPGFVGKLHTSPRAQARGAALVHRRDWTLSAVSLLAFASG